MRLSSVQDVTLLELEPKSPDVLKEETSRKASRFSDCDDCKAAVKGSGHVPAAAILTEMRSFVPGTL